MVTSRSSPTLWAHPIARFRLEFVPPTPGVISSAHHAAPVGVLESTADPALRLQTSRVTLLGFIYHLRRLRVARSPRVFDALKKASPQLGDCMAKERLSRSPSIQRATAGRQGVTRTAGVRYERGLSWYFITTRSARELLPRSRDSAGCARNRRPSRGRRGASCSCAQGVRRTGGYVPRDLLAVFTANGSTTSNLAHGEGCQPRAHRKINKPPLSS